MRRKSFHFWRTGAALFDTLWIDCPGKSSWNGPASLTSVTYEETATCTAAHANSHYNSCKDPSKSFKDIEIDASQRGLQDLQLVVCNNDCLPMFIMSAKWTKWIGGHTVFIGLWVCLHVCVRSEAANQTVGALNTNSSKTVKATDFRFDAQGACFQGQSGYDTFNIFRKGAVVRVTWPDIFKITWHM